ncbi:MAG: DUF1905 domain-containing protein [Labilithrix sp.]|nr:DUF1905 domain-containing protein [Labilithrix sp.]MCW5812473.1 DUF1905 domain-containing protein [Labilithrix sp.]
MSTKKTVMVTLFQEGSTCAIPVPFDPKEVFGKTRAKVVVTINRHTYRSTIASMGGSLWIPLRKSNREAAGVAGSETLKVTLELDEEKREVKPPADLVKALEAAPPAWDAWKALSFSHQREHVEAIEEAKKPETRARRLEKAVEMLSKPKAKSKAK